MRQQLRLEVELILSPYFLQFSISGGYLRENGLRWRSKELPQQSQPKTKARLQTCNTCIVTATARKTTRGITSNCTVAFTLMVHGVSISTRQPMRSSPASPSDIFASIVPPCIRTGLHEADNAHDTHSELSTLCSRRTLAVRLFIAIIRAVWLIVDFLIGCLFFAKVSIICALSNLFKEKFP